MQDSMTGDDLRRTPPNSAYLVAPIANDREFHLEPDSNAPHLARPPASPPVPVAPPQYDFGNNGRMNSCLEREAQQYPSKRELAFQEDNIQVCLTAYSRITNIVL